MNILKTILAITVFLAGGQSTFATNCDSCSAGNDKVCVSKSVETTKKTHCFEVETKEVCIPKFRLPWKKCCQSTCGRVRTIKVLKKISQESKSCGCEWEIISGSSCDDSSCDAGGDDTAPEDLPAAPDSAAIHVPETQQGFVHLFN